MKSKAQCRAWRPRDFHANGAVLKMRTLSRARFVAASLVLAGAALFVAACSSRSSNGSGETLSSGANAVAGGDAAASGAGATAADDAGSTGAPDGGPDDAGDGRDGDAGDDGGTLPGSTEGCPAGMVRVEGEYCPEVLQKCLGHSSEYAKDKALEAKKKKTGEPIGRSNVSERCLKYEAPSVCLSKQKRRVRFCVDRYEWPNEKGTVPALLVSWVDAKKLCEEAGKRLCTEDEFNFACEGEEMLPYTYGFERDPTKCNIDRPYRKREHKLSKYARCMKDPACKAELEKLDQRLPAGSLPACVSPFGAYDMNGNINEWVSRPKEKPPNRSGLKGGWWGPVRGRCRPTVGFHKEEDYGYEEGFRCCADAK